MIQRLLIVCFFPLYYIKQITSNLNPEGRSSGWTEKDQSFKIHIYLLIDYFNIKYAILRIVANYS